MLQESATWSSQETIVIQTSLNEKGAADFGNENGILGYGELATIYN